MGDNISVDWSAAPTPQNYAAAENAGYDQAFSQDQKAATMSALSGVNVSDPNSVSRAVNGLVRAGAGDAANALSNLSWQRQLRSQVPAALSRLSQLGQGGAPSSDAQPAAVAAAAPQSSADEVAADASQGANLDQAHATESMNMARQAIGDLQQLAPAQRPAAFSEIKNNFVARGVPEAAIDQVGADLSDSGLQKWGALFGYHAQNTPLFGGQAPQPGADGQASAAPVAPPHPTDNAWARQFVGNPMYSILAGQLKAAGLDTGIEQTARALVEPEVQQEAQDLHAPGRAAATEAATNPLETTTIDIGGRKVTLTKEQAVDMAQRYPGLLAGLTPGETASQEAGGRLSQELAYRPQIAGQEASATEAAKAPYEVQTIMVNGRPVQVAGDVAKAVLHNAGAIASGVGSDLTPGSKAYQQADAKALQDTVTAASSPDRQASLKTAEDLGAKIGGFANAVGTGAYTQQLSDIAARLPVNHSVQQYATNASLLGQDLAASFKASLGGMGVPRLQSEAAAIMGAIPHNTAQPDQLRLYGAGLQAASRYAQAHDQFMVNYAAQHADNPSQAAAQAAWNNGPGRVSLLADPAYRNLTLSNGQPAVKTAKVGAHTWGVFMPGTKQQFKFLVQ